MVIGKTIKTYLIDGDPNGRMTCELSSWAGKAYKIPRINIKYCDDRIDLKNTGVYFLFGKNEEQEDIVYIGEAENIFIRLNTHDSKKDFWNETIIFISKDDNLNKAHIKYLENRFYEMAHNTKRYKIENTNIPTQSSLSESDKSEMEEFILNAKILVNALGHKVFEEKFDLQTEEANMFFINSARGSNARGIPSSDGFVVLSGSEFAITTVNAISPSLINFRNKLIYKGVLVESEKCLTLSSDYVFSSPSMAASIVMGRNANGLTEWKLKSGMNLKDFQK